MSPASTLLLPVMQPATTLPLEVQWVEVEVEQEGTSLMCEMRCRSVSIGVYRCVPLLRFRVPWPNCRCPRSTQPKPQPPFGFK